MDVAGVSNRDIYIIYAVRSLTAKWIQQQQQKIEQTYFNKTYRAILFGFSSISFYDEYY